MTTFIALLRGINVGGHRVKMERLRELFCELELSNVRSFIQSGNIFFETGETDLGALSSRIEKRLGEALGYAVPVFLRALSELERSLDPNPFENVQLTPDTRLLIAFTAEPLLSKLPLPARSPDGSIEILAATASEIFVVYRLVYGRPPPMGAFLKQAFGKTASVTTRFYGTTLKMLHAARSGLTTDQ